jgi:hypothetical protein
MLGTSSFFPLIESHAVHVGLGIAFEREGRRPEPVGMRACILANHVHCQNLFFGPLSFEF